MTSLDVICGLSPPSPQIKNPGYAYVGGPIFAFLCPGNTVPSEDMTQRWQAVGNIETDLTGRKTEPQTCSYSDARVAARPT